MSFKNNFEAPRCLSGVSLNLLTRLDTFFVISLIFFYFVKVVYKVGRKSAEPRHEGEST